MYNEGTLDELARALAKHPLHREIYRKTLLYCRAPRILEQIEYEIASFPEFKSATQNQVHFLKVLVELGALEQIGLDECGEVVPEPHKGDSAEDRLDELVVDWMFMITDLGEQYVEVNSVERRIGDLFAEKTELVPLYEAILNYCDSPRSYKEIADCIQEQAASSVRLADLVAGLEPSVFVSSLEKAGGLVWDEGWVVTPEGGSSGRRTDRFE